MAARSFKRLNGELLLVIELPDGSPGTIPARATDVLGPAEAGGPPVVLDARVAPVGADNLVTAVDLVFSCRTRRAKFGIWLRESAGIRHCQYPCHCESLI